LVERKLLGKHDGPVGPLAGEFFPSHIELFRRRGGTFLLPGLLEFRLYQLPKALNFLSQFGRLFQEQDGFGA